MAGGPRKGGVAARVVQDTGAEVIKEISEVDGPCVSAAVVKWSAQDSGASVPASATGSWLCRNHWRQKTHYVLLLSCEEGLAGLSGAV